jgi:hypothetical protein
MFISERREPLFSFPGLPESVAAGPASDFVLRPFGLYESDLNVDFEQAVRPFLVTEILECCTRDAGGGRVDPDFFWGLTVGKRIECLLHLLLSANGPEIGATFLCPNEGCGQELEIEISLEEIGALQAEAYAVDPVLVPFEKASWALRRPTGSDQLAWLKSRIAAPEAAIRTMVRTLRLPFPNDGANDGDAIPNALVPMVEQALEEFDPLVNFSLQVNCFSCGAENQIELDLEEFSLRRLRQAQLRLLASVHKLAAHYHWSEQQIFSVPYWRRARYLSLIEKEKNQ